MPNENMTILSSLLENAVKHYAGKKSENEKKSILFNPLTFLDIGETKHSFIIAKLLNPNTEHGQGRLFLNNFLNKLNIEYSENENWVVTAEKDRIDILIKREKPRTVIIIENKSNYAIDQENQIYRYWFEQVHSKETNISNTVRSEIIYLTPVKWKTPNENSLVRPTGWSENLPEKVPIEHKIWLFNREITEWLDESLLNLSEENIRMRVFVEQYKELIQTL